MPGKSFVKKVLSYIFSLLILLSTTNLEAIAQQDLTTLANDDTISIEISSKIPAELEESLKESIKTIYGEEKTDEIYKNVVTIINGAKDRRPLKLHQQDLNRAADWYKDEIIYMFYVDHFGRIKNDIPGTFNNTTAMLDYLQDLGITTIYMLPFMDSPMGDAGFDVKDAKNVREDLGGTNEFSDFIYQARKRGFKIKADLVLNHFSDQHKWFQEALKGDKEKINYFVYREKLPKFKKYKDPQKGVVVDYIEDDGSISSRRLIFPDIAENHFRKVNIKGKDYYFYHTFYPFQIDINWKNPQVLYEILETITFWANLGVDVFRVDAIPYFIKKKGTPSENLPETHAVVQLLSSFLQAIAPRSIMLAEACQWPHDILPYFGEEQLLPPKDILLYFGKESKIKLNTNKEITRTNQVQVGYHFPYMPAIWASLITGDNKHFWKADKITPKIPDSATWAIFLRVHDELTLEMVDLETRKLIYNKLIKEGKEFREGLGVSGRMANFLEKDPRRINLAFSILLSLPGIPIIYYGDEIGAENNMEYAEKAAKDREIAQRKLDKDIEVISFYDSRDINRGPITQEDFYEVLKTDKGYKNEIYNSVKAMIKARKDNVALRRGKFERVESNHKDVLSYLRDTKKQKILVLNNLKETTSKVSLKLDNEIVSKINNKKALKDLITEKEIPTTVSKNEIAITMQPYQKLWLELE